MRIVHLVYEGIAGGVLRVALKWNENLLKLGFKSIVITAFANPIAGRMYSGCDKNILSKVNISLHSQLTPYVGGFLSNFIGELAEKISLPFKPDWIVCHNLTPIGDAVNLSRRYHSKIAVVIHNPTYPPSVTGYIFSQILRNIPKKLVKEASEALASVDLILAIHEYNVKLTKNLYGLKAYSVPLGCDPQPIIPPKRGDYLLVASRLSIGKNVHVLAKAIAMADKNAKVFFVGAFHHTTPKVLKLIKKSGLKNYKVLINVPERIFRKLFLGARAVIYGLSETDFLLPASHGAPIICLKEKYAGDVLKDGIHGYIIEDRACGIPIEKYANCINVLLTNERMAWKMGYEAWNTSKNYTWLNSTTKLVELLQAHN
jgi:glycosyltransferase involved in cell wall biosynthesis